MNVFKGMSLKIKILLIVVLPLSAYLYVSGSGLLTSYKQLNSYNDVHDLAVLSTYVSNLVHELQKERGASAGFLGSKGKKFGSKLREQRVNTDTKKAAAKTILHSEAYVRFGSEFLALMTASHNHLENLRDVRARVSAQTMSVQEAVVYYSKANGKLLDIIGYMTHLTTDAELANEIGAYYNFLQSKERAGKERAVLSNVFSKGHFSIEMYGLFVQLVTEQKTYISIFETLATAEAKKAFKETVRGRAVEQVEDMRKVAREINIDSSKSFNIDAVVWFDTITSKINLLKEVEDHLSSQIERHTQELASSEKASMTVSLIVFVVILLASALLVFVVTSTILNGISQATSVALELAEGDGDLTKRMNLETGDEIGLLGRAIDRMLDNLSSMIGQIQGISGELDTANAKLSELSSEMHGETENVAGRASTVAAAAEEMSVNMDVVANAVENAAQNVANVAEATEAISVISNEISTGTEKARSITNEAVTQAANSSERVHELGQAADEIGKVTETITEISSQTNLLALNATIEAARAGEAGKGFAVVANEIKDLAKQTADATLEIKSKIEGIQLSTRGTVQEIEEISKVIEEINEIVTSISTSVESQTTTSAEIAGDIKQASYGIQEVTENVNQASTVSQEVAHNIAEVDQSSNQMLGSTDNVNITAEELDTLAKQLQSLVGRFRV